MKVVINTDSNSYITDFFLVNDDYVGAYDIDIYQYDVNHINCYKFISNTLILDDVKLEKVLEEEEKQRKEEEKKEEEAKKINEQTLRLAEMFVAMGVNSNDFMDRLDAQTLYTALMTDTLIESEENTNE